MRDGRTQGSYLSPRERRKLERQEKARQKAAARANRRNTRKK